MKLLRHGNTLVITQEEITALYNNGDGWIT